MRVGILYLKPCGESGVSLPSMDLSAPPDDVELCAADTCGASTAEFGGGGAHIADEQLVACIAVRS